MTSVKQILIPVAIVGAGLAGAAAFKAAAPKAEQREVDRVAPAVEVVEVEATSEVAQVRATGLVTPAQRVAVSAEVNARVIALSADLLPGGRLARGAVVARLDARDFALGVKQEQGRVRQAEVELELERGRNAVAAREWELLGKGEPAQQAALALRQPQLLAAVENLEAAKSGLARAQLKLERTTIRAPFNAMVLDKKVDIGQLVGPSATIATLIGTDEIWVDVSVPLSQLRAIDIPGVNAETGSAATVSLRLGSGVPLVRDGRVLRLKGELDDKSRTARLLITVPAPFEIDGDGLPLLPGAYVEVTIAGRTIDPAFRVPRVALDGGDQVWVVAEGDRLEPRSVEIAWREPEHVVVTAGLAAGERLVVSPLKVRARGMRVAPLPVLTDGEPRAAADGTTDTP